jgi:nitroreductase
MDVKEAIDTRRSYRSLEKAEITDELVRDLAQSARLSASCFNNQPWRYVFVYGEEQLEKMKDALSPGNAYGKEASMIIAILSRPDLDCQLRGRDYYLFDTGMATAQMFLRATELGLVAHPIVGFSQTKTREALDIPDDMQLMALVLVGKKADRINPVLDEGQQKSEKSRPERLPLERFAFIDRYTGDDPPPEKKD